MSSVDYMIRILESRRLRVAFVYKTRAKTHLGLCRLLNSKFACDYGFKFSLEEVHFLIREGLLVVHRGYVYLLSL